MQTLINIFSAFWATLAEMAPWLILGFLFAGVLSVFFSPKFVSRHLGGRGVWPTLKAAVLGVPLPLCSCGVIPVGAGLFKQGASRGATSSFLLSTPQTGVDSIAATYALMGPVFAVVRPVVALMNGLFGGLLIDAADRKRSTPEIDTEHEATPASAGGSSCCSSQAQPVKSSCCSSAESRSDPTPSCCSSNETELERTAGSSCCGGGDKPATAGMSGKVKQVLRYGLVTLPADIAGPLVIGVTIAALLAALVPDDALAPYLGGGLVAMLAAVVVGAPLYICATASIPVGLGLMAAGASPGAVLAFLIAGPATNAATMSVTWNLLGRRTGVLYLISVITTAVVAGLALDAVFTIDTLRLPEGVLHPHEHGLGWVGHVWAVAMLALLLPALFNRFVKPRLTAAERNDPAGENTNLNHEAGLASRGVGAEP